MPSCTTSRSTENSWPSTSLSSQALEPGSIASLETVRLGGIEQYVLIRGHDASNPVLLFLHGGPGMPAMYLAHAFQRELERDFVIVHWDRLGAGKSYAAGAGQERFSVRRTLDDTLELIERLIERFGGREILLVGHSWGSYLGSWRYRSGRNCTRHSWAPGRSQRIGIESVICNESFFGSAPRPPVTRSCSVG